MQAPSILFQRGELLVGTYLDYELGSPCYNSSIRRRKGLACYRRSSAELIVSTRNRRKTSKHCVRRPGHDFGSFVFTKHSIVKFYIFREPVRDYNRTSFASAWALEGQEVEGVSTKGDSNSLDRQTDENVGLNGYHVNNVEGNDLANRKNEKPQNCSTENVEEFGKGRSKRIDVRALGSDLQLAKTPDDVEEVLKDMNNVPLQVYSSLIRAFGRENNVDSALALFNWLKRKKKDSSGVGPNLFIYNSLLGTLKQTGKYKEGEEVMNDMAAEGIQPNIVTYNTLMGIYLAEGREVDALNLFEEIQLKGLCPSPASYSTALLAYRRLEDGFGALNFFLDIREKYKNNELGNDLDEDWNNEFAKLENFIVRICYQVVRQWLVKTENLSTNVLKLLAEMDMAGLQTGKAEYERLVWACTRDEHYVVAKELYSRIRDMDSEISLSVCNHIIWLMGKAKKWWAALEVYEDLLDKGPKPNNMSYELVVSHFNTLLTAAKKRGIWRWGVRLLNKMEEKGIKPGSREWNAVLIACSKAAETSAAVQIFKRMIENGEKPTVISYGALLSALEKGKLYDEALQVWKHMLKMGVEPNLYAYTIMGSVYAGQGKFGIVDSIIQEMVTSKIEPTVVTFNAIISACARNNFGGSAYEWFERMKVHNVEPNEVSYEMLIEALTNDGKPRLAYDMYVRAYISGMNLSVKAYDAVIESAQTYISTIDVSSMGPRPRERKKKVQIRKNMSEFSKLAGVPRRGKPFERKELYAPETIL
ncbi:protein LOW PHOTOSYNTHETIC EFFICIENCY 1, chloroplastic [Apium graveolens]|uniref:protein LOW PHOTOSYNTHETIC EFFICIENCY 1, chloroplastic n=1 Tax=Apium graveolens TaxID=4045 RepID=UPI003D79E306